MRGPFFGMAEDAVHIKKLYSVSDELIRRSVLLQAASNHMARHLKDLNRRSEDLVKHCNQLGVQAGMKSHDHRRGPPAVRPLIATGTKPFGKA